ncbi:MAG: pyrroline-5-carboxylate reductase [Clostridia bacterium]|nr:pyrroline-5-carboxylate reductase [Clostridia bacterium]
MKYTLGFIGVGNMGSALLFAALRTVGADKIAICDTNTEKTESLALGYGVAVATAEEIAANASFVILGVKPYAIKGVIEMIAPHLHDGATLVSMAAGVPLGEILRYFGDDERSVIRMMPNTPCAVGMGVIQYAAINTSEEKKAAFVTAFSAAGLLDEIAEGQIDAASALSGCGPAFVYLFAEALADGAVACGLPRDKAIVYAAKTLQGAGKMLEEYRSAGDLKDAVCSPGGTTIAGVHALEKGGLRGAAMDAVLAAYEKTLKLKS